MPGPAEQLLLAFGLDLSPIKQAAQSIQQTLDSLNRSSAQASQQSQSSLVAQKAQMDELRASLQAATAQEKLSRAEAAAKLEQLKGQNAELRNAVAAQRQAATEARAAIELETAKKAAIATETAEAQKLLAQRRAETAEIQKQITEMRRKTTEERAEEAERRKQSGEGASLISRVGGAVAGRGLAGSITAGVLGGGGAIIALQAAKEAVTGFVEKLREATIEAGNLERVQYVFEGIAKSAGFNAAEQIKKMQEATEGEVDKLTLLRTANTALNSSANVTSKQLVQLMGDVSRLAQASGNSAEGGVAMLGRALSRGGEGIRRLGVALPLVGEALRTIQPPPGMDRLGRSAYVIAEAIKRIHDEAERLNDLPMTLENVAKQLETQSKDLVLSFGKGFNEAPGADLFMSMIQRVVAALRDGGSVVEGFGRAFGNVMGALAPAIEVVRAGFEGLSRIWTALLGLLDMLTGGISKFVTTQNAIKVVGTAFLEVAAAVDFVSRAIASLFKDVQTVAKPIVDLVSSVGAAMQGNWTQAQSIGAQMVEHFRTMPKELVRNGMDEMKGWRSEWRGKIDEYNSGVDKSFNKKRETPTISRPDNADNENFAQQRKLLELRLKNQQELDRLILEEKKAQIERDKALDNDAYSSAEESADAHFKKQRDLAKRTLDARLEEFQNDRNAQVSELQQKHQLTPNVYTSEDLAIETDTKNKELAIKQLGAQRDYQKQLQELDKQQERDRLAILTDAINKQLELTKDGLTHQLSQQEESYKAQQALAEQHTKAQAALTEKQFSTGQINPNQYNQQRTSQINQQAQAEITGAAQRTAAIIANAEKERDAQVAAAEAVYRAKVANGQGEKALQIEQEAITKARQQAEEKVTAAIQSSRQAAARASEQQQNQLQKLEEERAERTLEYINKRHQPQQQALETRLKTNTMLPGGASAAAQDDLTEKVLANLAQQRSALEQALTIAQPYSDTWYQIQDRIEKTYESQIKYNEELAKMRDLTQPLSTIFSSVGSAIPTMFHSNFAQNLGSSISSGARSLEMGTQRRDALTEAFNPDNFKDFSSGLQTVTKGLTTAVSAVADFASTVSNAKSAVAGGVGGAVSGAGVGQTFSGVLGKVAPALGPFGSLIGAGVGGVVGAFTGSKQNELTNNLNKLQTTFKDIMNKFAENNNNLQQTIVSMTSLIAQAQAMQAKSKKGGGQYTQLIQQYQQQLQQLDIQQTKMLSDMREQLASLNSPVGTQDFISQLKEIIDQYDQFGGAAKNAQDLADANQWLAQSLAGYVNNLTTTFAQDQQQAIQDALSLNDLLFQRQELMVQITNAQYQMQQAELSYQEQVAGILSAGDITRTRTVAQTKGMQLEQLTIQHNMQMEQMQLQAQQQQRQLDTMNADIQVTQFKVQAEQQIFQLAATRIGLEGQLVAAQESAAGVQLQSIQALQNFLQSVQSGNLGNISGVAALLSATPGFTSASASVSSSSSLLQGLFSSAYQDYAAKGYAGFNAVNLG